MPYANFDDLQMFYEEMGTGEPVVFLHSGYSGGILAFASQMPDFQAKYRCYFPDFRGHGRTRCESLAWNTPTLCEDIVAFMDAVHVDKAHLVGYSLGANVGLYVTVFHPHRVLTLTTIGTSGFCDPSGADDFEPEALIRTQQTGTIAQMTERHFEAHRGNWQEHMRQSAADWREYPKLTADQLRSISVPTLLISGEHDPFVGETKLLHLAGLVPDSQYLVVQGSSHRPHMLREQPILVNEAILSFLQNRG